MAGRPPKPTGLKLVQGNPGKRSVNRNEPDPDYLQDLTPPAWLSPRAAAVWNEIAPALRKVHVLTEIDVEQLAHGCVAIAQYRLAHQRLGERLTVGGEGEVSGDTSGDDAPAESINPWMVVQSMSFKQAMAVMAKFGMNPADRTRIMIQPQGDLFGRGDQKASSFFTG